MVYPIHISICGSNSLCRCTFKLATTCKCYGTLQRSLTDTHEQEYAPPVPGPFSQRRTIIPEKFVRGTKIFQTKIPMTNLKPLSRLDSVNLNLGYYIGGINYMEIKIVEHLADLTHVH